MSEGTPVSVTAVLWLSRDVVSSQGILKLTIDLFDSPIWNVRVCKGSGLPNQLCDNILITTLDSKGFEATRSGSVLD